MKVKQCKCCSQIKPTEEFFNRKKSSDGKQDICKECSKLKWREYYKRHKNNWKYKEQSKDAVRNTKAKQLNVLIDKDITLEKVYTNCKGVCQICGESCSKEESSIDHIIPLSRGGLHAWNNVQLAHLRCNDLKGTKSMQEYKVKQLQTKRLQEEYLRSL